ncbi:[FeFe] hydrogenase H-cluster radical SAM maturase HydE [Ohessyouella blattaphilus]|uniref:[FeFe] hydrogenase H-cluster radical SAM maturase HydE n=1 Tax=Ohessyouella blattaphilus TaxID=2949333 RepID=A0ABT1EDX1_9FIRM|nr:[FeFe] hydrogenase H-cluster radical SAM maturase HydE [Ohessyouella blattaphilus]MCP1108890.1 [FeFe] hydrogenase H-cluster radical SAM maturase HydE [Ohessyouella blattaphilus]MCR8562284.1 [FeFe] hydrogenase H-cluster radical SAM maturase HydE [Ohessyouella blattaphilus]
MRNLIRKLDEKSTLEKEEWIWLFEHRDLIDREELFALARARTYEHYEHKIFVRGLIEFTNYCRNNCYYCGIRSGNQLVSRFRLTTEEILDCCQLSYEAGFRTVVLQGGEDAFFTKERLCEIIEAIRRKFPEVAITLSIGERPREDYEAFFLAGAERFLLRHETYSPSHYARLHPENLSAKARQKCLTDLKEIGYQAGSGFMVGSPYQTPENLAEDFLYLKELDPQMIGIGPFIAHKDTPFGAMTSGTVADTLLCIALLRLMLPKVLLPSTTSLGALALDGRKKGVLAGANVLMQNVTPSAQRLNYTLYNNKERAKDIDLSPDNPLFKELEQLGYAIVSERGDSKNV